MFDRLWLVECSTQKANFAENSRLELAENVAIIMFVGRLEQDQRPPGPILLGFAVPETPGGQPNISVV